MRGKEVAELERLSCLSATSLPPLFGQAIQTVEWHVNAFGIFLLQPPCRLAITRSYICKSQIHTIVLSKTF